MQRLLDRAPTRWQLPVQAGAAILLGLIVGIAFLLPVLAWTQAVAGQPRTVLLLVAAGFAILLVRRAGRWLRVVLDTAPQPWRLPLLGLYGLAAMGPPVVVLLVFGAHPMPG